MTLIVGFTINGSNCKGANFTPWTDFRSNIILKMRYESIT